MFKVGDIVEITAEAAATGMLDFTQGHRYRVLWTRPSEYGGHLQVFMLNDSGITGWYHQNHFKLKEDTIVEKKECLFKEGQVVWDLRVGRGVVEEIVNDELYPVKVKFDLEDMDGNEIIDHYMVDGRYMSTQTIRSLYFSEPKIEAATEPLFEPTLKYGDVVMAVDDSKSGDVIVVRKEDENVVTAETGISYWKSSNTFYRLGEKINFK